MPTTSKRRQQTAGIRLYIFVLRKKKKMVTLEIRVRLDLFVLYTERRRSIYYKPFNLYVAVIYLREEKS